MLKKYTILPEGRLLVSLVEGDRHCSSTECIHIWLEMPHIPRPYYTNSNTTAKGQEIWRIRHKFVTFMPHTLWTLMLCMFMLIRKRHQLRPIHKPLADPGHHEGGARNRRQYQRRTALMSWMNCKQKNKYHPLTHDDTIACQSLLLRWWNYCFGVIHKHTHAHTCVCVYLRIYSARGHTPAYLT